MLFSEFEKLINELLPIVQSIVNKYYRKDIKVEEKADFSPVTACDIEIERIFKEKIAQKFSGHAVMGEESGLTSGDSEYSWIIDPIDGTKSFISGVPLFSTLIALIKDEQPVFGAYINPVLNDVIIADNKECRLNGVRVTMRSIQLHNATLLTSDHNNIFKYQKDEGFEVLRKKIKIYRTWGDGYGYFLLASGFADIMIDPIVSAWDALPIIPIIRGAGGVITDYQGNDPVKGKSLVACHPDLHDEVIRILNMK
ncbi:MAG TPA: inositol monophosphatase family protein [Cytophagaceae bacterium]